MEVSKEEIIHISKLAHLKLNDNEIDEYIANLQDILNFANVVNNAPVEGLEETIGTNNSFNVFRKDEIVDFNERELLLQNAPEKEEGMFRIPKVIN